MPDPGLARAVLDRHAAPEMVWRRAAGVPAAEVIPHARAPLGQDLVDVAVRRLHPVENVVDEIARHALVEQVAHRIDEDHARFAPPLGLIEARRPKAEIEALLVGVTRNAPPVRRKTTSRYWIRIGSRIGPDPPLPATWSGSPPPACGLEVEPEPSPTKGSACRRPRLLFRRQRPSLGSPSHSSA